MLILSHLTFGPNCATPLPPGGRHSERAMRVRKPSVDGLGRRRDESRPPTDEIIA